MLLGICLGALSSAAAAQSFPMKQQAGVRWVCAGVGVDEREAFAKLESQSNLKLVFSGGKHGAYVADVSVALTDRAGKTKPLQFAAAGPICLVHAPAGEYRLEAAYGGAKQSASAALGTAPKQPATLIFNFPEAH